MIRQASRFKHLWDSRSRDYTKLSDARNVAETLSWGRCNRLLGFNQSSLRLRILQSLAAGFGATHFIETGTYHGATSIAARRALKLHVSTCEFSRWNYFAARLLLAGLPIEAVRADSPLFIGNIVAELQQNPAKQPFFYLDAHAGIHEDSCPILEELSQVVRLESFLVLIDDFEVPGRNFDFRTYGTTRLGLDLIRDPLLRAHIRHVFFPAFSPELENGIARTGYVIFFRSTALDIYMQNRMFPLDLLQSFEVSKTGLSQLCASS